MQDTKQQTTGHGLLSMLPYGIGAGLLGVIVNVGLTLLNAPSYQQAAAEGSKVTTGLAYTLLGLQCVSFLLTLLICFIAGFLVGRATWQRSLGFYAGALAGLITYLASFVVRYIPNYPGNIATNTTGASQVAGGIVVTLVFLCIWCFIGGLIGLWGASTGTRRSPVQTEAEAEIKQE
jgi:uncharacterized BrkB/YihY/UPF0761 family membrane protein